MLDLQKREQDQPIPFDRKPYHCSSFNHMMFICAAHIFPSITFLCKKLKYILKKIMHTFSRDWLALMKLTIVQAFTTKISFVVTKNIQQPMKNTSAFISAV
jgi:hypothetical protein